MHTASIIISAIGFASMALSIVIAIISSNKVRQIKEDNIKLLSQKKSSEVRTGQIAEQMAPFLKEFKYDPKKSHFMGMPIDYIVFEDDRIVIVEVKSGNAVLTKVQSNIKRLIEQGKVYFETVRIK
jgi:predicted Holliday junction resolvase-like endonuclease